VPDLYEANRRHKTDVSRTNQLQVILSCIRSLFTSLISGEYDRVRHIAIYPALIIRTLLDSIGGLSAAVAGRVLRGVSAYNTASIRFDTPSLS
jgi:hypothetical protein